MYDQLTDSTMMSAYLLIGCVSTIHLVILATVPLSKGSLQRSCVSAL
jgi:hypothetical protein